MGISEIANLILIPYLWWFGYALDETSVAECRDSIAIQQKESDGQQHWHRYKDAH
jgi:hypothetical protein